MTPHLTGLIWQQLCDKFSDVGKGGTQSWFQTPAHFHHCVPTEGPVTYRDLLIIYCLFSKTLQMLINSHFTRGKIWLWHVITIFNHLIELYINHNIRVRTHTYKQKKTAIIPRKYLFNILIGMNKYIHLPKEKISHKRTPYDQTSLCTV